MIVDQLDCGCGSFGMWIIWIVDHLDCGSFAGFILERVLRPISGFVRKWTNTYSGR